MSADNVAPARDALQFDRALSAGDAAGASAGATVTCANCRTSITTAYYHIGSHVVCERCRETVQASFATPRGWKPFLRAAVFGMGAAIAGAIVYYAVIAIANLEIGIVAILIGYMVGYMIRKATGGKGGRRFQILALVLTYWSVGLAYTPLVFKGLDGKKTKAATAADSARVSRPDSTRAVTGADSSAPKATATPDRGKAPSKSMNGRVFLIGVAAILFLTFALPVLSVFGSLPSGLITAFIIFIGLRQAWRMTAAPSLTVSGPYTIGGGPKTATA
jgi:hypothetical protein